MHRALIVVALVLASASPALAQVQEKPFLDEERRKAMEKVFENPPPEVQDFLLDYGGWFHFEFTEYDDKPLVDQRTYRFSDLRLWGTALFSKKYRLFARLQTTYTDFNEGDQFGREADDADILRVDQAWFDAPFDGALGSGSLLSVKLGRQYVNFGTGLLLNSVLDGLVVNARSGLWTSRAAVVHTIVSKDDQDATIPDNGNSRRAFAGFQTEYAGFRAARPYGVFLVQRDLNDEDPEVAGQDFEYHSMYLAGGLRGEIVSGLGYTVEADYEIGTSTATGSEETEAIRAFALQANLECYVKTTTSPVLYFGYLFGSGDEDRLSPTDTIGGNVAGSDDTGFNAFGFLLTGYSLSPRLSNLHIVRLGASFKPFEKTTWGTEFDAGFTFYLYRKARSEAGISDPRAYVDDADVGQEVDLFARWRMYSDLQLALSYGLFLPGGAYDEDSRRGFLSVSTTLSF